MPLVPTAQVVAKAQAGGHGIGAFNVVSLEQAEAVARGAERAELPVIVQVSENAVKFHRGELAPLAAACAAVARGSSAEVALHLDHVESFELLMQAADNAFGSVMYDGSTLPYEENLAATGEAVRWGHDRGLWVESELGAVGGKGGAHAPGVRTDPDEAAAFVAATGVDGLAVAVGSEHRMRERTAALDVDLVARLATATGVPLVLHGSSGVPDDELRRAVAAGIVKVNVGTALGMAFTAAVRQSLTDDPAVVDPRRYLAPARDAAADVVSDWLVLLAST